MKEPHATKIGSTKHGWLNLIGWAMLLILIWMVVLPSLARVPMVAAHRKNLDRRNINADAMFYSELNHFSPSSDGLRLPISR
jgi:hypothetical protein